MVKKTRGFDQRGYPIVEIIGYTATREEGLALLAKYNQDPWDVDQARMTLRELYELWVEKRAGKLGESNRNHLISVWKNYVSQLGDLSYRSIRAVQMQDTIDGSGKGPGTQAQIKSLWTHLDRFALELDLISVCYSGLLKTPPKEETSRQPFTDAEVQLLWEHVGEPWVDTVLIFLYTGWRISELLSIRCEDVDLEQWTMTGGLKTDAGKNRVVPIHTLIRPLVKARLEEGSEFLISENGKQVPAYIYRDHWKETLKPLGISHLVHEARHTVETALDRANGNRKCIDMIMGHVSKDTGNRVYNHKTLEELRQTVELISYNPVTHK